MYFLTELYSHQIPAVQKLSKLKVGALYMEQGTGKTRTALELINIRLQNNKVNHVIWLCPCSVKENLRRDIIKHTGLVHAEEITICGIETLSNSIKWNLKLLQLAQEYNCYLIVDESNMVKNYRALRTTNIIRLSFSCKYKLILNGTPITKNEADLFAQWYILDWRILGYKSFWSFAANHLEYDENVPGKIRRCLNVDYLSEKIGPYSYQIKKSDCLDLPDKIYKREYYILDKKQNRHYAEVADMLMFELDEFKPNTIYRLFTGLQDVISGLRVSLTEDHICTTNFFKNIEDNPRIQCLLRILDRIDDKVIIFCKYTHEIDSIVDILSDKYGHDSVVRFDGSASQNVRQKNIIKFENKAQFFVANKNCGCYGLNLQFCSYEIYYSNDWDFGTRAQSEDRTHRIGQCKNVCIIDICAADTLDERILRCLDRKENLVDSFKSELEKVKYKTDLYSWIRVKGYNGKRHSKRMKSLDKSDLSEVM